MGAFEAGLLGMARGWRRVTPIGARLDDEAFAWPSTRLITSAALQATYGSSIEAEASVSLVQAAAGQKEAPVSRTLAAAARASEQWPSPSV